MRRSTFPIIVIGIIALLALSMVLMLLKFLLTLIVIYFLVRFFTRDRQPRDYARSQRKANRQQQRSFFQSGNQTAQTTSARPRKDVTDSQQKPKGWDDF